MFGPGAVAGSATRDRYPVLHRLGWLLTLSGDEATSTSTGSLVVSTSREPPADSQSRAFCSGRDGRAVSALSDPTGIGLGAVRGLAVARVCELAFRGWLAFPEGGDFDVGWILGTVTAKPWASPSVAQVARDATASAGISTRREKRTG